MQDKIKLVRMDMFRHLLTCLESLMVLIESYMLSKGSKTSRTLLMSSA